MLSQFTFQKTSSGEYKVIYRKNFKYNIYYVAYINDMTIIDATKNSENPKKKDINTLRRYCIYHGSKKHDVI